MNKIFSYLSIVVFASLIHLEFFTPNVNAQASQEASSKDISIEESNKIFNEFGGKKGEVPVTMFVTSWCPVCVALEKTFKNAKIDYAKADVESNRDAMLHYQKLVRGRTAGVPATLVGEELLWAMILLISLKQLKT